MRKSSLFLFLVVISLATGFSGQAQDSKNLNAEYIFKLGVTYEMTNSKPGSTPHTEQTTFWLSESNYSGFELVKRQGMLMVYDLQHKQMLSFMADQKMVMVMDMGMMGNKLDSLKQTNPSKVTTDKDVKIVKTGKTEKILGYSCDQYQVTTAKGNSLFWVTKELGTGLTNFAQGFSQMMRTNPSGSGMPDLKAMGNGVMLKMETTSVESGASTKMEAKSISKEVKTIRSSDYKVMAMPNH